MTHEQRAAMYLSHVRDTYSQLSQTAALIGFLADQTGDLTRPDVADRLVGILALAERDLLPSLVAEEEILYPALIDVGTTSARTELVRIHHDEIKRLTQELRAVLEVPQEQRDPAAVRRAFYGLETAIRIHVRTVEHVLLPALEDELDEHETSILETAMRAAANSARFVPAQRSAPA